MQEIRKIANTFNREWGYKTIMTLETMGKI